MHCITNFFNFWAPTLQTIFALVFGLLSIILVIRDKKNREEIQELKNLTKIIKKQYDAFLKSNTPHLTIVGSSVDQLNHYKLLIDVEGGSLFNLEIGNSSDHEVFSILTKNENLHYSKGSRIALIYEKVSVRMNEDTLSVKYLDEFGRSIIQKLYMKTGVATSFSPPVIL